MKNYRRHFFSMVGSVHRIAVYCARVDRNTLPGSPAGAGSQHYPLMVGSRISAKGQITLPKAGREAIGASPGDMVVYEVEGNAVRLRWVDPFDVRSETPKVGR